VFELSDCQLSLIHLSLKLPVPVQIVALFASTHMLLWCIYTTLLVHCLSKKDPDIFDFNLKADCPILAVSGKNIPDTTGHYILQVRIDNVGDPVLGHSVLLSGVPPLMSISIVCEAGHN